MGDDVDDVLAHEPPGAAEEVLDPVVVVVGVEEELPRHRVQLPPGKSARRLDDVLLGVVADAHGEAFHELPGEILVGGVAMRRAGV